MRTLVLLCFVIAGAFCFPQDIVAEVAEGIGEKLTETVVEGVEKSVSVEGSSSSADNEIASSGGFFSLGDNLLSILAEVLIPFLGTLQDMLSGLANGVISGLIATLKSVLEGLLSSKN